MRTSEPALSSRSGGGLLLPTVFTLGALCLLVGLGVWQWQRMAWKNGLIAKLNAAGQTTPRRYGDIDLSALPAGEDGRYTPVAVTGRFDNAHEVYVFWARGQQTGFLVLTPFVPVRGRPILVNRGFVPDRLKDPKSRASGQVSGEVTVRGLLVRRDGRGSVFTPEPDVAKRIWYAIRPAEMTERLGLDIVNGYTIDADATPNPGGWPKGVTIRERITAIPNRHFEYALTWWGIALTLVGVYAVFVHSRLRSARTKEGTETR